MYLYTIDDNNAVRIFSESEPEKVIIYQQNNPLFLSPWKNELSAIKWAEKRCKILNAGIEDTVPTYDDYESYPVIES